MRAFSPTRCAVRSPRRVPRGPSRICHRSRRPLGGVGPCTLPSPQLLLVHRTVDSHFIWVGDSRRERTFAWSGAHAETGCVLWTDFNNVVVEGTEVAGETADFHATGTAAQLDPGARPGAGRWGPQPTPPAGAVGLVPECGPPSGACRPPTPTPPRGLPRARARGRTERGLPRDHDSVCRFPGIVTRG